MLAIGSSRIRSWQSSIRRTSSRGIELCTGGLERLLRALELGARRNVSRKKKLLALEIAIGLHELRLGGGNRSLRGAQSIVFARSC